MKCPPFQSTIGQEIMGGKYYPGLKPIDLIRM